MVFNITCLSKYNLCGEDLANIFKPQMHVSNCANSNVVLGFVPWLWVDLKDQCRYFGLDSLVLGTDGQLTATDQHL